MKSLCLESIRAGGLFGWTTLLSDFRDREDDARQLQSAVRKASRTQGIKPNTEPQYFAATRWLPEFHLQMKMPGLVAELRMMQHRLEALSHDLLWELPERALFILAMNCRYVDAEDANNEFRMFSGTFTTCVNTQ